MHICVFTTAHPWDDVRVKSKFVDSFLDAGDKVTWIGPDRSFFQGAADRDTRINYDLVSASPGWGGRIASMRRLRSALAKVKDADWVYCPDPDAVILARTVPHANILFDIHEEYHKGHFTVALPLPIRKIAQLGVKKFVSSAALASDMITSVNPAILSTYRANPSKSLTTYNTPPRWFSASISTRVREGRTTFFHGKALAENGTDVILQALRLLAQESSVRATVLMFRSPGGPEDAPYDPNFLAAVQSNDVGSSVDIRDGVKHKEMPGILASVDVGFIAYNRRLGVGSLPNRFFEYMAQGIPVIVPAYSIQMREIVERDQIGLVADFEDPASVAEAMTWMASHPSELEKMGRRAKSSFETGYAWEPIFESLRERLQEN